MSQSSPIVLSLGSVNADFQVRIDRRPEVGETVVGRDFLRVGGGKAANVAAMARKLGLASRLLAHVGDDDLAEQALAPLRRAGVDVNGVATVAGAATGVAMIQVPPDGAKGIVLAANANEVWSRDEAAAAAKAVEEAPDGSVLVVDCELPGFVAEIAADAAKRRGLTVILDPSPADRVSAGLLAAADVVVANAAEAETLTGIRCDDAAAAARAAARLVERGAAAACVKLGDGGCVFSQGKGAMLVTGPSVEVVDTTGAGDAFAGSMAAACAQGRAFDEAVRLAVAAAARAVTGYGSRTAYPTRRELDEMLQCIPEPRSVA